MVELERDAAKLGTTKEFSVHLGAVLHPCAMPKQRACEAGFCFVLFCFFPFVLSPSTKEFVDFGAEAGYGRDANMGFAESAWR